MDYEECMAFTFDQKIKNLLRLISKKDVEKFQTLTGKNLVFKKSGVFIDGKKMPDEPQDFTFSLIEMLSKKDSWESLDEKGKAEKFYDFFWERIQNLPLKKKKVLLEILDCIIKEKKIKEHSVVKRGELVDVIGVDFEECCFQKTTGSTNGKIVWKKNTKTTALYSYV